jgi:hypothetical protein
MVEAVMRIPLDPVVLDLLGTIVERLAYLSIRVEEASIELEQMMRAELAKKAPRRDKIPIALISQDNPLTLDFKQWVEKELDLLKIPTAHLQPLPPGRVKDKVYWRSWVHCLQEVRELSYRQEARIQQLERVAAASRPDGG